MRPVALVAVLVLCVAATACGGSRDGRPNTSTKAQRAAVAHNRPVTHDLVATWESIPRVTDASATYQADVESSGLQASAACDGCALDDLETRLVRDVWRADLQRLTSFTVNVGDANDVARQRTVSFRLPDDRARLEASYGARPAGLPPLG